jgi:hypothetical protein
MIFSKKNNIKSIFKKKKNIKSIFKKKNLRPALEQVATSILNKLAMVE